MLVYHVFAPVILIYELDLNILKMYSRIKWKFLGQGFQKLEYKRTDRQIDKHTHTQTRPNALPQSHLRVVKIQ